MNKILTVEEKLVLLNYKEMYVVSFPGITNSDEVMIAPTLELLGGTYDSTLDGFVFKSDSNKIIGSYLATHSVPKYIFDMLVRHKQKIIIKCMAMSDELYDQVRCIFEVLGGKWIQKYGGFLFLTPPTKALTDIVAEGHLEIPETYLEKEKIQFYPTPTHVADTMVELAEIQDSDIILEPSAGRGNILGCLPDKNEKIVIELDHQNADYLRTLGYDVIEQDFLSMAQLGSGKLAYNKVIMNPPFSNGQDADHVMFAYDRLQKGGILVAIINENRWYYPDEKATAFKSFLHKVDASIMQLQEGTFQESGTLINALCIKITKKEC